MEKLTFQLTVDETNQILEALGNMPFKSVFGLIQKIQSQAEAQLQDQPSNPKPTQTIVPPISHLPGKQV